MLYPVYIYIYFKKGIVITTDSLLLKIQMSEHNSLLCGGEVHDNLPHSQPTFLAINCVHASSLDKLMVKMTILFLLWTC